METKEGQKFFYDGYEKIVTMPRSAPGSDIGVRWRRVLRALEYTITADKRCKGERKLIADIGLREAKFNVVNYIDEVNIGIGAVSFGVKFKSINTVNSESILSPCPAGQEGTGTKLIVHVALFKIIEGSATPSIGPFSADNGYSEEMGKTLMLYFKVEFEQRCCCPKK
ncbi:hypothetical protein AAEX28_15430 [Lentisphaerota bacterium WC36G]